MSKPNEIPVDSPPRLAFSPEEFARAHGIGRATLYSLWRIGRGPARIKLGRRTIITREAADAWRAQLLAEAEAEK